MTHVVRNQSDAERALAAVLSAEDAVPTVRFDRYPRVVVTLPEPIGIEGSRAAATLEKIVHRQYCLLKYRTVDLRRLTAADKRDIKLGVEHPHPTQMVLDLSRAATAAARVVRLQAEAGRFNDDAPESLFASNSSGQEKESLARAGREMGLSLVRKVSPVQAAGLTLAAIIVAGISYSAPIAWKDYLKHSLELQAQSDAKQLRLAELDSAAIVPNGGSSVSPAAHRAVERDIDEESRRVRSLVSFADEGPYSRFVKLVDHARPALLDLARSGTININGLTVDARTARTVVKATKKAPENGWEATVRPTPIDS